MPDLGATISDLKTSFAEKAEDGFKLREIFQFLFEAVRVLIEQVEFLMPMPGPQKAVAVTNAVREVYRGVDPDLPWIPEPFETMLEDMILSYVVPAAITTIVSLYNRHDLWPVSNPG